MLPFDIDRVHITVSKPFRNTWMRKWGWDHIDLREGIREAHTAHRLGKKKWEIFLRKKGGKKLVVVYEAQDGEVFVITGSEG